MKRAILDAILQARSARRAVAALTWLDGDRQELYTPGDDSGSEAAQESTGGGALPPSLVEEATEALRSDRAHVVDLEGDAVFVQPLNPPLRLIIVGAVHIAQHLAEMARATGYDVWIVDPRTAFATPERFPGFEFVHEWPDEALGELGLDRRCAVVTLTHDPKLDDPALRAALDSSAFYVGSLGSRKNHAKRLARLRNQGLDEATLARIHGPVGLDIGARTPAEIAVAILAQMTQRLRGAP